MVKKMSIAGVGHKILLSTAGYLLVSVWLSHLFPSVFRISGAAADVFHIIGGVLIAIWCPLQILSMYGFLAAYRQGELATKGIFAIMPHPLYTNGILFLVPGLSFLFPSWLVFTTPVIMYLTYRFWIREEEEYLEQHFGEKYLQYRKGVFFKHF